MWHAKGHWKGLMSPTVVSHKWHHLGVIFRRLVTSAFLNMVSSNPSRPTSTIWDALYAQIGTEHCKRCSEKKCFLQITQMKRRNEICLSYLVRKSKCKTIMLSKVYFKIMTFALRLLLINIFIAAVFLFCVKSLIAQQDHHSKKKKF